MRGWWHSRLLDLSRELRSESNSAFLRLQFPAKFSLLCGCLINQNSNLHTTLSALDELISANSRCEAVAARRLSRFRVISLDESQENILPSLSFINHDRSHSLTRSLSVSSFHQLNSVSRMLKKLREDSRQSNDDTVGNIK